MGRSLDTGTYNGVSSCFALLNYASVPERASSLLLLAAGLMALVAYAWRKRR